MNPEKYSRRKFLQKMSCTTAAVSLSGLVNFINCSDPEEGLPNIILIFTDDQGYADVGCFGAKGFETPNLDKMADEGIKFTNFYVSQAVCSASRSSLMTGCYAERVSIRGALNSRSQVGLNPAEETIAEVLKKKGYATAIFGKWHLGHHKEFLPLQHGFDEYLGLPYSNDMWPYTYDGKPATKGRKSLYPPLPLIKGNDKIEEIDSLEDQAKLTTLYTDCAVKFIEKHKDKPFFLYVPHSMPHTPLGVSEKFSGKAGYGKYGDVIMEIDWSVGEILKTLKENDLEKNTLVIFTSDNGPWMNFGTHAGSAYPLREGKGTMWEGGPRVPCIMKWPGKIPEGTVCEKIASTIDILPTLAAITGAPLPEKKIDGVNILPLIKGDKNAEPRDHFFYYYGGGLRAVRKGKWKLVFPHTYRSYLGVEPGKNGLPGPYGKGVAGLELYDLKNDIGEKNNVIEKHPDIKKELEELAETARDELGDTFMNRKGKGVREPGRVGGKRAEKVSHLAVGGLITYNETYNVKYTGGGDNGLVNGIKASSDYMDGNWQGFEGSNMDVIIDLKTKRNIREISSGFLQNQTSWIFLPKKIEFFISTDGKNFELVKSFVNKAGMDSKIIIKEHKSSVNKAGRYIRVKAENIGKCPSWHPGAGGKAWIFTDEIVVK